MNRGPGPIPSQFTRTHSLPYIAIVTVFTRYQTFTEYEAGAGLFAGLPARPWHWVKSRHPSQSSHCVHVSIQSSTIGAIAQFLMPWPQWSNTCFTIFFSSTKLFFAIFPFLSVCCPYVFRFCPLCHLLNAKHGHWPWPKWPWLPWRVWRHWTSESICRGWPGSGVCPSPALRTSTRINHGGDIKTIPHSIDALISVMQCGTFNADVKTQDVDGR